MNQNFTNKLISAIAAGNLDENASQFLTTGKQLICIFAGTYLFLKSVKNLGKHPILAIQGIIASSMMIYKASAETGPTATEIKKIAQPNKEKITIAQPIDQHLGFA